MVAHKFQDKSLHYSLRWYKRPFQVQEYIRVPEYIIEAQDKVVTDTQLCIISVSRRDKDII